MKIPHFDIKQDGHISVMTCMKCYIMEEHTTAQCVQEPSFKICFECSSSNYTLRDCNADIKKCIFCKCAHSTLGTRCPKIKELINKKRKAEKEKSTSTYSNALQKNISNPFQFSQPLTVSSTITPVTHTRIYQSMLHAHFVNIGNQVSFSKIFNSLMKANNLPALIFPEEPPSFDIIFRPSKEES